jgi:hypothetical protein
MDQVNPTLYGPPESDPLPSQRWQAVQSDPRCRPVPRAAGVLRLLAQGNEEWASNPRCDLPSLVQIVRDALGELLDVRSSLEVRPRCVAVPPSPSEPPSLDRADVRAVDDQREAPLRSIRSAFSCSPSRAAPALNRRSFGHPIPFALGDLRVCRA